MSITKHHAEWLSLIEVSGPFLSLPVLKKMFPQGLEAHDAEHARVLRQVHEEWDDNQRGLNPDPAIHTQWIRWVLRNTLELDDLLVEGQAIPQTIKAEIEEPQHRETLRPDMVLMGPDKKPRLLIQTYPLTQKLGRTVDGKPWKASPDTRMTQLLRDTGVQIGLVTNGDQWMLVYAPPSETSGYASWYSTLWLEESKTLAAFRTLLGVHRFFGVPDDETLVPLLAESASHQQEVTDQLGSQVRSAVEILIQSLDRADQDYGQKLLGEVPNETLYESALTVMMRLVFLFCAEERELLLLGDQLFDQHYAVSTLVAQLQETADQHGEEILERRFDAWCRLLSTFRAVYGGVHHDRMRLPAYAGNLFNPDRFPFLEGRKRDAKWKDSPATPLPVNNRTVLHLLRSLQYLELHGEAQRLSFRALDIEQIGHVYEGLLDHTAKRAGEPFLGLVGKKEPEVALSTLEELRTKGDDALFDFLKKETGSSRKWANSLDKELASEPVARLRAACGNDDALYQRVLPYAGLIRNDSFNRPVVVGKGSVYVTAGTDRRSSGTHYTPRSLTEPIVRYTLEPLVYEGPAEGWDKEKWKLRSPKELLDLKICDMACGSGAFLVQACRYMSERLQEAWATLEQTGSGGVRITPFGDASTGDPDDQLIPDDSHERVVYARRVVSQRCLYGIDINPLAVEMAKLSLWLLTLAKDKPFTFLDHSIRCGDSLVGISNINQLERFSLNGKGPQKTFAHEQIKRRVDAAKSLRMQLERMSSNTVDDIERKTEMLARAEEQTARLRYAADMLLAAHWQPMSESEREQELKKTLLDVEFKFKDLPINKLASEAATKLVEVRCRNRFHWAIEFPEVFDDKGLSAFVGNPPFQGGTVASTALGLSYMSFIKKSNEPWHGKADLVGAFFRRAFQLPGHGRYLGYVATASLIRGETVESSINPLIGIGIVLYRGRSPFSWPGQANVTAVNVWLTDVEWSAQYWLDNMVVNGIHSDLEPAEGIRTEPETLGESSVFGALGVKLSPANIPFELGEKPVDLDADIVRVLGGDEIYGLPDLSRSLFAVDVDVATSEAPGEMSKYKHSAPAKKLREKIASHSLLFACGETTHNQLAFIEIPISGYLLKHKAIGFPTDSWSLFSILQSELHVAWAWKYGIRRKEDLCYSPKRCSATFPTPQLSDSVRRQLEKIGKEYHAFRSRLMTANSLGLTKLYNHFHDPESSLDDLQHLRDLHAQLNCSVAGAYGWNDIPLKHAFQLYKGSTKFSICDSARRILLGRLLDLNLRNFASNQETGSPSSLRSDPVPPRSKNVTKHSQSDTLFDLDEASPNEKWSGGLLCDLVQSYPGLPISAYLDALVIVAGVDTYAALLIGDDAKQFKKEANKIAKQLKAVDNWPWHDLLDTLTTSRAIVCESVDDPTAMLSIGDGFDRVRAKYPACDPGLIALTMKAVERQRELRAEGAAVDADTMEAVAKQREDRHHRIGEKS